MCGIAVILSGAQIDSSCLKGADEGLPASGDGEDVLVLGATNRPHAIDAALMRPGRFDLVLYVPPPDMEAHVEIMQVHTRHMKLDKDVGLERIAAERAIHRGRISRTM